MSPLVVTPILSTREPGGPARPWGAGSDQDLSPDGGGLSLDRLEPGARLADPRRSLPAGAAGHIGRVRHRRGLLMQFNGLRGLSRRSGSPVADTGGRRADGAGFRQVPETKRFGHFGRDGQPFFFIILKGGDRGMVRAGPGEGEKQLSWRLAIAMPLLGRYASRKRSENTRG